MNEGKDREVRKEKYLDIGHRSLTYLVLAKLYNLSVYFKVLENWGKIGKKGPYLNNPWNLVFIAL